MDTEKLNSAIQAYQSKDFDLALMLYKELEQENPDNPYLMMNTASAFYKTKHYGDSLAHYYSAKKILARNKDLKHNLTLVSNDVGLNQPLVQSFSPLNLQESLIIFLIFNVLFLLMRQFKIKNLLSLATVLVLFVTGINLTYVYYQNNVKEFAAVKEITTKIYSGNDESYTELDELLDGQIVEISHKQENWSKIKHGKINAWIKNDKLAIIK